MHPSSWGHVRIRSRRRVIKALRTIAWPLLMGALLFALMPASPAQAIPAFARAYNVPCSSCHSFITRRHEFGDVSNPGPDVIVHSMNSDWNGTTVGNVVTVGSAGSQSYYGAKDMSGSLFEWVAADPNKPDPFGAGPYQVRPRPEIAEHGDAVRVRARRSSFTTETLEIGLRAGKETEDPDLDRGHRDLSADAEVH